MHLMQLMAAVDVGQYINLWKLLPVLILLLIWARLMTWMDKDAIDAHLPRLMLNSIEMLLATVGIFMFVLLPTYIVALSAFVLTFVAGGGGFFFVRRQKGGVGGFSKKV